MRYKPELRSPVGQLVAAEEKKEKKAALVMFLEMLSPGLGTCRGRTELLVSSRRNGVSAGVFSFFFCRHHRNVNNTWSRDGT